jgi:hypothetical protein
MKRPLIRPIHIWAVRDALRRPFESLLTAAALFLTIVVVGTGLLVPHALFSTVRGILKAAPSIIVRRVNPVGWQAMPAGPAVAAATQVTGVVDARPRVWGVVAGPSGPLTVVGISPDDGPVLPGIAPDVTPASGQAIVGPGVSPETLDEGLLLSGAEEKRFDIISKLPSELGIVAHDLVLLSIGDTRQLLGLPEGYASDLAVDVFHSEEEDAILSDLSAAFPWPVRLRPRNQSVGMYSTYYSRRSAIALIAAIPSILAICLLVAVNVRKSIDRKKDMAILKAVGWTTGDIVRLLFYRVAFIGLPSASLGMATAFLLVFGPLNRWIGTMLLGWSSPPPLLHLDPEGALIVLLEVSACVLIPFMGSALSPALTGAARDVQELLQGADG